jgi:type VI protein secretion system component Hcp
MIALQRSAGNTSAVALVHRARGVADDPPITLTLPGVVDHAAVSSWSLEQDARGTTSGLEITRVTDADSPALAKALTDGEPHVQGRLVVRKLTPLGWVRELTLAMADCIVDSYLIHEDHESVRLSFTGVQVEQ